MGRWIRRGLGLALVFLCASVLMVRAAEHDPAKWHVDPTKVQRTEEPHDALAAPEGTTTGEPDIVLPLTDTPAEEQLKALDAVARSDKRVEVVAGSVAEGWITYVQRSALFGFPDYISVKTVTTDKGNSLALWSRSRYGYYDLGVNKERLERWLTEAGLL